MTDPLETILETLYLLIPELPRTAMTDLMFALEQAYDAGLQDAETKYDDYTEGMKEANE